MDAIDSSAIQSWDHESDLVIIGLGAAGSSAALEAYEQGAEVIVLERTLTGGGASALSEGLLYLGGGTEVQRACGHDDDAEQMFAFLRAAMPDADEVKLRAYCDASADHHLWLERHGVPFARRELTSKAVSARGGEGLLVTGNEYLPIFREVAKPAPRGHQVTCSAEVKGGVVLMRSLLEAVAAAGIECRFETTVRALVLDESGAVVGVVAAGPEGEASFRARRGVVVATGSFALNERMVAEHLPLLGRFGVPLGVPENDGSGIGLGLSAGVDAVRMDAVIATSPIYPPQELMHGILVNGRGERFVSEDSYHGRMADLVLEQPDQRAYLVVDEDHFAYPEARPHELLGAWESAAEIEAEVGFPAGSLAATLARHNEDLEAGRPDALGKGEKWRSPLVGPLAVFDVSLASSEYRFIPLGGLATDRSSACLDPFGAVVRGLYAAGACAAHLPATGSEYASGLSLGPGTYFARVAVRSALGIAA